MKNVYEIIYIYMIYDYIYKLCIYEIIYNLILTTISRGGQGRSYCPEPFHRLVN